MKTRYLYRIVLSGYYNEEQWRAWADNIILKNEVSDIEDWIYNVSLAGDREAFFRAIHYVILPDDDSILLDYYNETDIVIGYYYLMYKEGRIDMKEMLDHLDDSDDPGGESAVYWDNNLKELFEKTTLTESDLVRLDGLFAPLAKEAEAQKKEIESYMV